GHQFCRSRFPDGDFDCTISRQFDTSERSERRQRCSAAVTAAGPDGNDFALGGLFLGGVRDDDAAGVKQVMKQTRARIYPGDTRSECKLLSVFEPSTEVIRKGKAGKPNEFGKMVKLQEAENQIVIDFEVYDKRPNDCDLLVPAIEIHQATLGRRTWSPPTP